MGNMEGGWPRAVAVALVTAIYWTVSFSILFRTENILLFAAVGTAGAIGQGVLLALGKRVLIHAVTSLFTFVLLGGAFFGSLSVPSSWGATLVFAIGAAIAGVVQASGLGNASVPLFAGGLALGGGGAFAFLVVIGALGSRVPTRPLDVFSLVLGVTAGVVFLLSRYRRIPGTS